MSGKNDYFSFSKVVSIVLAIIPFTAWFCGIITRFQEKKYLACLVRAFLGFNIIWIVDLFFMITEQHIWRLLDK